MADTDLDSVYGVVDKRVGRGGTAVIMTEQNNYSSISAMRTRLIAINATTYTTARLNAMTRNDLLFALRSEGDNAGIK